MHTPDVRAAARLQQPDRVCRSTCAHGAPAAQKVTECLPIRKLAIIGEEWQKGVLDGNSEYERHTCTGRLPQRPGQRLAVVHLERLPLGLAYPDVVQQVKDLL